MCVMSSCGYIYGNTASQGIRYPWVKSTWKFGTPNKFWGNFAALTLSIALVLALALGLSVSGVNVFVGCPALEMPCTGEAKFPMTLCLYVCVQHIYLPTSIIYYMKLQLSAALYSVIQCRSKIYSMCVQNIAVSGLQSLVGVSQHSNAKHYGANMGEPTRHLQSMRFLLHTCITLGYDLLLHNLLNSNAVNRAFPYIVPACMH